MTITEIIQGIEQIQRFKDIDNIDQHELCNLSKNLALHVQQLEIEMRKMKEVHPKTDWRLTTPGHTCVDRPNLPCEACKQI